MKLALSPVKRGGGPAHAQIERSLGAAIGGLEAGTRLPSERELARRLRVARMTVRHALDSLERRGLVARQVGRGGGTFVAEPKLELTGLAALSDQLSALGLKAGARVLSTRELPTGPPELGSRPAYEIVRIRLADGEPVALERMWLPADTFPGLLDQPLEGSVYELMREHYTEAPARADERLEPSLADREDARTLQIAAGAPVFRVERIAYAASGRTIEFSRDVFRGDRVRVVWTTELP
jgi:DNA-binding GntR family transcriptional regulator